VVHRPVRFSENGKNGEKPSINGWKSDKKRRENRLPAPKTNGTARCTTHCGRFIRKPRKQKANQSPCLMIAVPAFLHSLCLRYVFPCLGGENFSRVTEIQLPKNFVSSASEEENRIEFHQACYGFA
jgi:hypothetical protein